MPLNNIKMQEAEQTYNALETLMKDDKTFAEVVAAVFDDIDKDKSGTLEIGEVEAFIGKVCHEMGIQTVPGKDNVAEVFDELDEDKSKTISKDSFQGKSRVPSRKEELGKFLRVLFVEQKNQLAKLLKKAA